MSKKLLLVGGGGHCKSVLDSVLATASYSEVGIVDTSDNVGNTLLGVPVVGCDDDLPRLFLEGFDFAFVAIGGINMLPLRMRLMRIVEDIGFKIPRIFDPTAVVSGHSRIDSAVFIGKNAVVNAGCTIHKGVIVNSGAIVEHDCVIEDTAHIAPGAVLCGSSRIGAHTHIGAGSVVREQVTIGSRTIVGMGSVVTKNVASDVIAYGNPCKEVRER